MTAIVNKEGKKNGIKKEEKKEKKKIERAKLRNS